MSEKTITDVRKEQIINAFYDCLSEKGHQYVTISEIVKRAGLSRSAIHYYFRNKEELIKSLMEEITVRYENQLLEILEGAGTSPGSLVKILDHFVDAFVFDPGLNRVMLNLVQMSFDNEMVQKHLAKVLSIYRAHTRELFPEDEEHVMDTFTLASVIVALIDGFGLNWTMDPTTLDRETVKTVIHMLGQVIGLFPKENS